MILIFDTWDASPLASHATAVGTHAQPADNFTVPPNEAARAKVGDRVRYFPTYPDRAHDLCTGVIEKITTTWIGARAWKIRLDGEQRCVVRYSSGGSLMIISIGNAH